MLEKKVKFDDILHCLYIYFKLRKEAISLKITSQSMRNENMMHTVTSQRPVVEHSTLGHHLQTPQAS